MKTMRVKWTCKAEKGHHGHHKGHHGHHHEKVW